MTPGAVIDLLFEELEATPWPRTVSASRAPTDPGTPQGLREAWRFAVRVQVGTKEITLSYAWADEELAHDELVRASVRELVKSLLAKAAKVAVTEPPSGSLPS
jgi:hypothetical protein